MGVVPCGVRWTRIRKVIASNRDPRLQLGTFQSCEFSEHVDIRRIGWRYLEAIGIYACK